MRTGRPSTKRFIYTAPACEKMLQFISDWENASDGDPKDTLSHQAGLKTKSRKYSFSFKRLLSPDEGKTDFELRKAWENIQHQTKSLRPETQIIEWEQSHIEELGSASRVNLFLTEHTNRARANFAGRQEALARLEKAWNDPTEFILTIHAWGGMGKSSVVKEWLSHLATRNYDGARVFGWTFNNRVSDGISPTSHDFIQSALKNLGDKDPAKGKPVEQSLRLAQLLRSKRTLLILESVEILQAPPGPEEGSIRDVALAALLGALAAHSSGLCVITTRTPILELLCWQNKTAPLVALPPLWPTDGAQLLEGLGVKGTPAQREQASSEMGGHPLALTLLGNYLCEVHGGDVTARHDVTKQSVPLLDQDEADGGQAIRMLASYEELLGEGPELSVLRLIGLFAHPVKREVLACLLQPPAINGLTDALVDQSRSAWKRTLARLRRFGLLDGQETDSDAVLDTHPLTRQFFGRRLQKQSAAWKEAHSRLYDLFSRVTPDCPEFPETLEAMAPLFEAVAHGCAAGKHQEALDEIYIRRISRGDKRFQLHTLSAYGPSLHAISHFFADPFHLQRVTDDLDVRGRGDVLSEAGFTLRASGQLMRAIEPLQKSLAHVLAQEPTPDHLRDASIDASNLSELFLYLGNVPQALDYGHQAIGFADRSGEMRQRAFKRTTLANALHWAGNAQEAQAMFEEAEKIQRKRAQNEPILPIMSSVSGYWYCDLLLEQGEYEEVQRRVAETLELARNEGWAPAIGLDQLSLGRAAMLGELNRGTTDFERAFQSLDAAIVALMEAQTDYHLPSGLLARAALHRLAGNLDDAKRDLEQAWSLSATEMKLHQLGCHIEFARWHMASGDATQARTHHETARVLVAQTRCGRCRPDVEALHSALNSV